MSTKDRTMKILQIFNYIYCICYIYAYKKIGRKCINILRAVVLSGNSIRSFDFSFIFVAGTNWGGGRKYVDQNTTCSLSAHSKKYCRFCKDVQI